MMAPNFLAPVVRAFCAVLFASSVMVFTGDFLAGDFLADDFFAGDFFAVERFAAVDFLLPDAFLLDFLAAMMRLCPVIRLE